MTNIIIFIIGFVVGAVAVLVFKKRKNTNNELLNKSHQAVNERKNEAKTKILEFLKENQTAKNNDIENLLNVSDATVTRYLDELEDEGKIVQEGRASGSFYKLK